MMFLTFEILGRGRSHGKKVAKIEADLLHQNRQLHQVRFQVDTLKFGCFYLHILNAVHFTATVTRLSTTQSIDNTRST